MTHPKPTYLGLLNAIAVGEARGDRLFRAWSKATDNKELRQVLDFVGIREREHAAAFSKRLCELGYEVRQPDKDKFKRTLTLARSGISDKKKFKKLLNISATTRDDDPFGAMFADKSIDPATGALLGRYIAEERDSGRRLQAAYTALGTTAVGSEPACEDTAAAAAVGATQDVKEAVNGESTGVDDEVLHDIAARLDKLTDTLHELKKTQR